jgi:hypothetical protein
MTVPFMDAYVRLLVQTCHKRQVAAMGGMSAQIPNKNDAAANEIVMDKVRSDKLREVTAGHDGTWVAHPALVPIAMAIFDEHMKGPNQYYLRREEVVVIGKQISDPKVPGKITDKGVRENVSAALSYCAAWISGNGCVPIAGLMEDVIIKRSRASANDHRLLPPKLLVSSSGSGSSTDPRPTPARLLPTLALSPSSRRRAPRSPPSPESPPSTSASPRTTCLPRLRLHGLASFW